MLVVLGETVIAILSHDIWENYLVILSHDTRKNSNSKHMVGVYPYPPVWKIVAQQ